jgi:hypothetical protein
MFAWPEPSAFMVQMSLPRTNAIFPFAPGKVAWADGAAKYQRDEASCDNCGSEACSHYGAKTPWSIKSVLSPVVETRPSEPPS